MIQHYNIHKLLKSFVTLQNFPAVKLGDYSIRQK